MKRYKLPELFELAKSGKEFHATHAGILYPLPYNVFRNEVGSFRHADVVADWEVFFEPEVIEFECTWAHDGVLFPVFEVLPPEEFFKSLTGSTWKVVCTEKVEEDL